MKGARAFLILMVASCTAALVLGSVNTDYDKTVDFSQFKTFAFKAGTPVADTDGVTNELMQRRLEEAIAQQLEAKGLKKVDSNPDLHVVTHSSVKEDQDLSVGYAGVGWGGWAGWGATTVNTMEFPVGRLVVDLLHSDSEKGLVWRGIVDDIMLAEKPEKNTKKIEKAVARMFEDFPPSAGDK